MSPADPSANPPVQAVPGELEFPVVGIGASAGCIPALRKLFEPMSAAPGMAFVVVVHLSPRHDSNLADILGRVTRMPVQAVRETTTIAADHVYVISPAQQLTMTDGQLRVAKRPETVGRPAAIDSFLRTLAMAHGRRAVGIVLSGTGSDGTLGLARLKECGGVTLAQAPEDAEYDGMPVSAIDDGVVDFVLPAAGMSAKLAALWENMQRIELPEPSVPGVPVVPTEADADAAQAALAQILRLLRVATGHDFKHYKRATVLRRIERRLQVTGMAGLPEYRAYLQEHPEESKGLLKDLLISVTNFFRDREAFDALEAEIDASLMPVAKSTGKLRAWVAGCATGEEAYSIAMLLSERAEEQRPDLRIQVFASDIDESAIAAARAAIYPDTVLDDVTPARLRRFFVKEENHVRVRKELRDRVLFAVHNLLRDPPFSSLDLICCRNLLIYFDRDVQQQVLEVFHFALKPGGLLFLGSSESADAAGQLYEQVDKKWRIFRADGTLRRRPVPGLPLHQRASPFGAGTSPAEGSPALGDLHHRLREAYAPPSILIDAESNILHSTPRAAPFLRFVHGQPTYNLLEVVRPELRLELRTAIFRARQLHASVEAKKVRLDDAGEAPWVTMTAHPIEEAGSALVLVMFDSIAATLGDGAQKASNKDPLLLSLEEELRQTREQLRGSIGESAKSTEDLRASNEELQAINEELRSATEELETSKEELQSVNEELITVNQELKTKVEETAKANDDLKNLIASTDIATVFVDRELRVKRFTPRASQLFNLIESDIGRRLLDITHRLQYEHLARDARTAFDSLRVVEREVGGPDGRTYLVRALPYRTHEDVIDGAVLNFIDITATRRAEQQVREGEANLRTLLESSEDYAIITTDSSGMIATWNQGAHRLFGFDPSDALGQSIELIFTPADRAEGVPQQEMKEAREQGRASDERWHLRKDGTSFFCSGILAPMYKNEQLVGYAKIARDLTDHKRAETRLAALLQQEKGMRSELQRASVLKDEFLAVMSHELKHPLNLIHVNAELLARLPEVRESASVARAASVIRRTVLSQAKIIDDLLDLSRARTGKLGLSKAALEWSVVVERVVDAVQADAAAKSITLECEIDAAASSINADAVRVEQIVWNLLSNALKFTQAGGAIRVGLSLDGSFGRLDVADTGQGISADFLPHVFEMFRQASHGAARSEGGLGIGLALVKHLVEEHGGRVAVASDGPGRGARFSVWLPLAEQASASPLGGRAKPGLDKLRVLLVDDVQDALESFATLLQLEGAEVTAVASGKAALEAAETAEFDLLFSDIAMPGMDGYALMEALRANGRTAKLPAIALTGFGRSQDVKRAIAAGFDAHLAKPIEMQELLLVVERLAGLRGNRQPVG